jgi:hypothetical protein
LPPRASSTRSPARVGDQRLAVGLEDLGADRHAQHDVRGAGAGALPARPRLAVASEEVLLVAVVDQGVEPVHRLGPDIAALAAVAAVGPAELHVLLATEADAAGAAGPGAQLDPRMVEELHRRASR